MDREGGIGMETMNIALPENLKTLWLVLRTAIAAPVWRRGTHCLYV